ncbi:MULTISPECIES: head maturation protease, ClpP-related [Clostridium]|uniref:ATP-dependent Clp protease proteolytic subunit n=1 Tax=Clostridium carnis TaxID=1530 RepID=A0ABY6SSV4_9CLOT|nr:head maturation protease, ClpP-related [Clostridium carnis]CAI3560491.1 ATP-dependent Clp protease, protease subunit [Clostridium neonatale]CAI3561859.1 ATP-dependent Clp protease, protease subunit [Clostridium neonatale]CAI3582764.1 ATP-dependent Clp protease, protease subunit [Clostridium neonatale]CAI3622515.1 ATP-dependent Clp protease, protease subunit [Clostridium neonatale]CAI3675528.1 ATP-dependent Clp protease, protease subunit [Clostridium neonatale]
MKKIDIKGRIIPQSSKWIYNWLGMPSTSPKDISQALIEANGDDVEFYVNSGGGSVYDGYEIYNLIREYTGNATFKIIGLAASAAAFICMAGTCKMSPLSEMMIHNASTYAEGPHQNMDNASNMLQITDHTIATAFVLKSGKTEEEIRNLMENETWLSAQDCKNLGLIDEIMFEENKINVTPTPTLYNAIPINDDTFMNELEKCKTIDELKKKLIENVENIFKSSTGNQPILVNEANIDDNINQNNIKEAVNMDINTLKNDYKDIYDQIVNEAVQNERNRIKEIEDLAIPGNEDLINKAKFETGITAEKVAVEIIKNQRNKGTEFLENMRTDADNANLDDVNANLVDNLKDGKFNEKEVDELFDSIEGRN